MNSCPFSPGGPGWPGAPGRPQSPFRPGRPLRPIGPGVPFWPRMGKPASPVDMNNAPLFRIRAWTTSQERIDGNQLTWLSLFPLHTISSILPLGSRDARNSWVSTVLHSNRPRASEEEQRCRGEGQPPTGLGEHTETQRRTYNPVLRPQKNPTYLCRSPA